MTPQEFEAQMQKNAEEVKKQMQQLPALLAADALRFVDDNFRNQSWEGKPWKAIVRNGTILVETARLKNSFNYETAPGEARIYTNVPYAAVHNEGFQGSVSIPAHKRSQYAKTGKGKKKKTSTGMVKAHSRKMNIAQRQFAPTSSSPSLTLQKQLNQTIETHFNDILKPKS